jgi:hypothetical protein
MISRPVLAALVVLALAGCRKPKPVPPEPPAPPSVADPESAGGRAFMRLTELEGTWTIAGSEVPASFEKVGRATAVAQRSGFYAVWYPDGPHLAATLFPDDGYHATLRSTKIEEQPGGGLKIELVADHIGNIPPGVPVARSVTVTLVPGGQQLTQRWVFRTEADDKPLELVFDRKGGPPTATAPTAPTDGGVPDAPLPPPIDPTKVIFPH